MHRQDALEHLKIRSNLLLKPFASISAGSISISFYDFPPHILVTQGHPASNQKTSALRRDQSSQNTHYK